MEEIDKILKPCLTVSKGWAKNIPLAVTAHKELMKFLRDSELSTRHERSFASKYLHFHCPSLFLIYDSRVQQAINRLTPRITIIKKECSGIKAKELDEDYYNFCLKCRWFQEKRLKAKLSPRDLDNLLLHKWQNIQPQ